MLFSNALSIIAVPRVRRRRDCVLHYPAKSTAIRRLLLGDFGVLGDDRRDGRSADVRARRRQRRRRRRHRTRCGIRSDGVARFHCADRRRRVFDALFLGKWRERAYVLGAYHFNYLSALFLVFLRTRVFDNNSACMHLDC